MLYTFIYYNSDYVRACEIICWVSEAILRRKSKVHRRLREARYCMYIICHLEFKKIASSCALGFAIMGGIGYIVKLLFIPINNIILSWFHYFIITYIQAPIKHINHPRHPKILHSRLSPCSRLASRMDKYSSLFRRLSLWTSPLEF